jgi:hypothetical protein
MISEVSDSADMITALPTLLEALVVGRRLVAQAIGFRSENPRT